MVTFWVLTACHRPSRLTKKSVLRTEPEMSLPYAKEFVWAVWRLLKAQCPDRDHPRDVNAR